MERKKLFYSLLPVAVALGFTGSGCSTTPDIADYLKLQCEADTKIEVASQRVEVAPGQVIKIGNQKFDVTEKGRLRYTESGSNIIEMGQSNFIVKGASPYFEQRYLVWLERSEISNNAIVNVSLNCQNPKEAR